MLLRLEKAGVEVRYVTLHVGISTFAGVREDEVEAAWAIIDPILKKGHPLFEYEPGTWGPSQADVLLAHLGGWHEPKPPTRAR